MRGKNGRIVAITGPMFSGKTSRLIELLEREMRSGRRTMLFKPDIDKRYDESMVVTHKGIKLPATAVKTSTEGIREIEKQGPNFDVIGIDEVQFWEDGAQMARTLDRLADSGKTVYISLLNRDHRGTPFDGAREALSISDEVYSLTAICPKCGEEATFTQRVRDGEAVFGETILVGGKEAYEPRCRSCFVRPKEK